MQALDEEFERQAAGRLGPEIFNEVGVRSLIDIKRVLYELDPSRAIGSTDVALSTQIEAEDESGRMKKFAVKATAPSQSRRDILLAAFRILRERQQVNERYGREVAPVMVNGRPMRPALKDTTNSYMWVDPLLKRWLGATRQGTFICWDLGDYLYRYDIFSHRLTRAAKAVSP